MARFQFQVDFDMNLSLIFLIFYNIKTYKYLKNKNFDVVEIAARLHHRAVVIHPFINGNGRWSRMLANIYLKQNSLSPTKWNEDLLAKENVHRGDYIRALKQADNGDYAPLIKLQGNLT
jgi:Fic family protein